MVDAIVSYAVQKLGDFLIEKVNIRRGVKDNVIWLEQELSYLRLSLRDAVAEEHGNIYVRKWLDDVRDVANEAATILDRYSFDATEGEEGLVVPAAASSTHGMRIKDRLRSYVSCCTKQSRLYDTAKEIEALKKKVDDIKRRRNAYSIGRQGSSSRSEKLKQQMKIALRRTVSFEKEKVVVGFEDVVETFLAELVKVDNPSLSIVSIHGMGGLGKTTLARKLYNSNLVTSHFPCRGWVCVSQEYSVKDLLQTIIKSFEKEQLNPDYHVFLKQINEVDLERHLYRLLRNECYLAVIDVVWDVKAWQSLKRAFPDNNNGSRVIITTRNKDVAMRADDQGFVHKLRFLSSNESWELFRKTACCVVDQKALAESAAAGKGCTFLSPNMEKLARGMVEKCQGLPLAIIVLGGILLHKKGFGEWLKVRDQILGQLKNAKEMEITQLLSLSYDELPFEMKQCFLYLGLFPEDCLIDADKLIKLWVAEEFIAEPEQGDRFMEDVAEDYLNGLIDRNLIQIGCMRPGGKVVNIRVHDLLCDLAIKKAMEENFLGIFYPSKNPDPRFFQQIRHAIQNQIGKYLKLASNSHYLKLRSLMIFPLSENSEHLGVEQVKLMHTAFKTVKVLDLRWVRSSSNTIPDEIGDLISLKFLGLIKLISTCNIPPTIGKLKKLQSLYGAYDSKYIFPKEICELKELRHLYIFSSEGRLHVDSLIQLQTLKGISFEQWREVDTSKLINIRELSIVQINSATPTTLNSISKLVNLQRLVIDLGCSPVPALEPLSSCQRLDSIFLFGRIENASVFHDLPNSITHLQFYTLANFTEDPIPILEKLPHLMSLMCTISCKGQKIVCSSGGFPQLEFLKFHFMDNTMEWQVEDRAMPMLRALTIKGCNNLSMVPEKIRSLPPAPDMYHF